MQLAIILCIINQTILSSTGYPKMFSFQDFCLLVSVVTEVEETLIYNNNGKVQFFKRIILLILFKRAMFFGTNCVGELN